MPRMCPMSPSGRIPKPGPARSRQCEPLTARARRSPIPRPEMLTDAARVWRERVPETGRLHLEIKAEWKRLRIGEVRITAADFRADTWDIGVVEPGIGLIGFVLDVAPGLFNFRRTGPRKCQPARTWTALSTQRCERRRTDCRSDGACQGARPPR
jgi:hypothetical protein